MELIELIKSGKPIAIIGRGPTAKYFNATNDFVKIGYNVSTELGIDLVYRSARFERAINEINLSSIEKFIEDFPANINLFKRSFELGLLIYAINSVAREEEIGLSIYLFGFDFHSNKLEDDAFLNEFEAMSDQRIADFVVQGALYRSVLGYVDYVQIIRAGFDLWSDVDPRFPFKEIDDLRKGNEVEIVAELTTNHHGDTNKLLTLIEESARAGANSIKLQKRHVRSFYDEKKLREKYASPFGSTFLDYRLGLELTDSQILEANDLCKSLGLKLFFSVLDLRSLIELRGLKELEFDRIKLPSTISEKRDYLLHISEVWKNELVISTGMTDMGYENWLLQTFMAQRKIFLMQCTSSYPTFCSDVNINVVKRYARIAETHPYIVPSFSSHDDQWFGTVLAVVAGARMVEKHVKLASESWSHFDDTALSVRSDFRHYCRAVRQSEKYLGNSEKGIQYSEHHKY